MSTLETWSDIIRRQGEDRDAAQKLRNDDIEARMPEEIAKLSTKDNEELLQLLVHFVGSRWDARETQLRQEFFDAIRAEILRRM